MAITSNRGNVQVMYCGFLASHSFLLEDGARSQVLSRQWDVTMEVEAGKGTTSASTFAHSHPDPFPRPYATDLQETEEKLQ